MEYSAYKIFLDTYRRNTVRGVIGGTGTEVKGNTSPLTSVVHDPLTSSQYWGGGAPPDPPNFLHYCQAPSLGSKIDLALGFRSRF